MPQQQTGQSPLGFVHHPELHTLPARAQANEPQLHGGFAVDKRPGQGHVYYGMPGCGLLRVSPDLTEQQIIELPADLRPINFHSTKIGEFDGTVRLFLPANNNELVVILTLEGKVDFTLPRPVFEEYQGEEVPFKPTDTVLHRDRLLVADGYGANYILSADLHERQWHGLFGGKTQDPQEHGRFGTAHGFNPTPQGDRLAIADRPHSRFEIYTFQGEFIRSYPLPAGSRPCGIDYIQYQGQWLAAVGSLDAPEAGRPAPIYILDAERYAVLSTLRPKEDLGIERADHIHNVVWHQHNGRLFLICQSWNPGHYFVLELAG